MKTLKIKSALAASFLLASPIVAPAQTLLTGGDASDGLNISSLGSVVYAIYAVPNTSKPTLTLQGVTFTGLDNDVGGNDFVSTIPGSGFPNGGTYAVGTTNPPSAGNTGSPSGTVVATATNAGFTGSPSANDTALLSLVSNYYTVDNTTTPADSFMAFRLAGLTPNATYTVNLLVSDFDASAVSETLSVVSGFGTGTSQTYNLAQGDGIYDLSYTAQVSSGGVLKIDVSGVPSMLSGLLLTTGGPALVPEPSTWALMFGGMGLLAFFLRRRVRQL